MVGLLRLPWANLWKALKTKVNFNEINTFACQTPRERGKPGWRFGKCQKIVANN